MIHQKSWFFRFFWTSLVSNKSKATTAQHSDHHVLQIDLLQVLFYFIFLSDALPDAVHLSGLVTPPWVDSFSVLAKDALVRERLGYL